VLAAVKRKRIMKIFFAMTEIQHTVHTLRIRAQIQNLVDKFQNRQNFPRPPSRHRLHAGVIKDVARNWGSCIS
jgi:hypothetical protein